MSELPDFRNLSLEEQIGQLIVVRASGYSLDSQIRYPAWEATNSQLQSWLGNLNLGGVILLGGGSIELRERTRQLQSWSKIPLFVAADIEEGLGQRFPGATWFPPPMALNEVAAKNLHRARQYAFKMGEITVKEALATGINWLLAPVVDVNNNPLNPVINIRAFSDRHEIVSELASAFIAGAKSYPVLTTAKHFPGHGDTTADSHLDLPAIELSAERLGSIELPPFQKAIASGVDSVMTAHLLIPAWDKKRPATLSSTILQERLRQQLSFSGLIVTDALIMGGIAKYATPEEVAVLAVAAGNDILLMPDNPEVAIAAIAKAVKSGRISKDRIEKSLSRIWRAKQKIIHNKDFYPVRDLATPQARETVNLILQDSLQVGGDFPLIPRKNENHRNLIAIDDVLNCSFLDLNTPAIAIPHQFEYQRQIVDSNTLDCILNDSRPTLLQLFIRGNPFRGNSGLTTTTKNIYQQLITRKQLRGLVIYGSPYVLDWIIRYLPADLPWVFTYGQMPVAQAIAMRQMFSLSGEREIRTQNFGF